MGRHYGTEHTIAVDFDGTLCRDRFPEIGEPRQDIIDGIKELSAKGWKIILHTCREDGEADAGGRQHLTEAVRWCAAHGVPVDAVNENPWVTFGGRKIYADMYIDDRAVGVYDPDDAQGHGEDEAHEEEHEAHEEEHEAANHEVHSDNHNGDSPVSYGKRGPKRIDGESYRRWRGDFSCGASRLLVRRGIRHKGY